MPQHKSAIKRVRQNKKRYELRHNQRATVRTHIKRVLSTEDKEAAEEYFRNASAYLDRMASKNVIHKNKAANAKSRMRRYVNSLS